MKNTLIIGAGGVGRVTSFKTALNIKDFGNITLASINIRKCEIIQKEIKDKYNLLISIEEVDASNKNKLIELIKKVKADILINVTLPYYNLIMMDACIELKIDYVDTANYENPNLAKFEYKEQWKRDKKFKDANITALLGSGFDPGVTNIFCAYAQKHYFDTIDTIDILDCNDGKNGYKFSTNFNPEINLREINSKGKYWENGQWIETKPMEIQIKWNYPEIGIRDSYLLYHEEMESLVKNIKGLKRIRFFMTFNEDYLNYLECLNNVGMLRIDEVDVDGQKIVPIKLLKTLLPDPATLGKRTKGKTNIGVFIEGVKNNKKIKIYIYNVKNHEDCYEETNSQGVSYTTGVPAMIGSKLILNKIWNKKGVLNIEEFDPDPFIEELNNQGLKVEIKFLPTF